ncbi:hypothetical protein XENTR_v10015752 [Xenopus tropicalis]|nr:hypothetical protein XENTR_v10015752 [Xenopus tropicalis]
MSKNSWFCTTGMMESSKLYPLSLLHTSHVMQLPASSAINGGQLLYRKEVRLQHTPGSDWGVQGFFPPVPQCWCTLMVLRFSLIGERGN